MLRIIALVLAPVLLYWLLGLAVYRYVLPPVTPLMIIRSLERGHLIWHQRTPLEAIAAPLALAVVAAEDSGFCLHRGVDLQAVETALQDYRDSGRLRGASTITMQVARNLFLWNGGGVFRKALEIPLALALDALWPKRRIVEVYLNIAEWGPGVFGAQAAARFHFRVSAAQLSPVQTARLAAVLPSPLKWSPSQPSDYVQRRARFIQTQSARLSAAQLACITDSAPH
ncbi:MAG: monofunctional biosynthetic peptidoglycan transglycosylase [Pseudomonadales bacterium]|nr:monofunctional biosynthetic peptidoglycan transglycosylase [Pseudomonadales bacterium]